MSAIGDRRLRSSGYAPSRPPRSWGQRLVWHAALFALAVMLAVVTLVIVRYKQREIRRRHIQALNQLGHVNVIVDTRPRSFPFGLRLSDRDDMGVWRVTLSAKGVSPETASALRRFPEIRLLEIRQNRLDADLCGAIAHLENLRYLELARCDVDGDLGAALADCHRLDALRLVDCNVARSSWDVTRLPTGLRMLDLSGMRVDSTQVTAIGRLVQLESLGLARTGLDSSVLIGVRELPRLEFLDVRGLEIDDDSVDDLSKLRALRWLVIDDTRLTESGLERLRAASPELRPIYLERD